MAATAILAIDQVAENQGNKHITINNAFAAIEQAMNSQISISLLAGDHTLTEEELTRNFLFRVGEQTAVRNLKIPANIQTTQLVKRFFCIKNDGAYAVIVKTAATGGGAYVTVDSGATTFCHVDDHDVKSIGSIGQNLPFTLSASIPGTPPGSNAEVFRVTMVEAVTFSDNFLMSVASAGTAATADTAFAIKRNGSLIGTLTFQVGGTILFTTVGSTNEAFNPGDILTVVAPLVQDATLADISFTLKGIRS